MLSPKKKIPVNFCAYMNNLRGERNSRDRYNYDKLDVLVMRATFSS